MLEKHTRRTHKCPGFAPRVTRTTFVFKPRRVARWCRTPRIVDLSSMFAHLAPFGACKSLLGKHLLKRSRAKRGFKIRPQRTIGELLESFLDHANKKCSIGVPLVTTAIAAFALCMKAVDRVMLGKHSCMFKVQKQMVALLVNIGGDVMSDLAGRVAQAHALVVRGRSNPNRPALVA